MALPLGFKRRETRQAIWKDDSALVGVTEDALTEWFKDGAAAHLQPFAINGAPTVFTYRPLRGDELRGLVKLGMTWKHLAYVCFQIGVRFPAPEVQKVGKDTLAPTIYTDETGFKKLNPDFVDYLEEECPGIVEMYGALVFSASQPTEHEKKASSPPSTEKPSSAATTQAASTAAGTAVLTGPAGVVA